MSPTRIAAALAADFGFVLAVAFGWQLIAGGTPPKWLGAAVGITAFAVTALFWPPRRRGRHRCR